MVHELIGITNGRVRIEHEEMLELRVGLCCSTCGDARSIALPSVAQPNHTAY
jgi:hypothetical protein